MKLLVTGATGFIGAHLVHRLVRDGHTVVALVRDRAKARALPASNVELLEGDLSLFERADTVLPACDAVIHLAGVVAAERVEDYARINFAAVEHLVACLERQAWRPRRLLFSSSLAAAGPSQRDVPRTEADACAPVEPYGASKLAAEQLLQRASFPTTSFRPGVVFGHGDPATITLFRLARRRLGFRPAGPSPQLSFVDVEDLVEAIVRMLGDDSRAHRTYFVSHPASTDQRTLWRALGDTLDRRVLLVPVPRPVLYGLMRASTVASRVFGFKNQLDEKQYEQIIAPAFLCSSAALQRDLAWTPRYDLSASLAKAADGFRRAAWL